MKKFILGLGSVAAAVAPVAAVVACGDKEQNDAPAPITPAPGTPAPVTPAAHHGNPPAHVVTQADIDALHFPDITNTISTFDQTKLKNDFGTDTTGVTRRQLGIDNGILSNYIVSGTATWLFDETYMQITFNVKAYSGTGDLTLTPIISSKSDSTVKKIFPETHVKTGRDMSAITSPLKDIRVTSTTLHHTKAQADTTPGSALKYLMYAFSASIDVDRQPTMTITDFETKLVINLGLDAAVKADYKIKVSSKVKVSGVLTLNDDIPSMNFTLTFIANDNTSLFHNVVEINVDPKD